VTHKGNRKRYSTTLSKMTSTVFLEREIKRNVPKETVLKEIAAKIESVKRAFLFLTTSGTFLYYLKLRLQSLEMRHFVSHIVTDVSK
jgi:hypothetical protein